MRKIFGPGISVLNRLSYPYKFALIGVLSVFTTAVLMYQFVEQINETIDFRSTERIGLQYEVPLRRLLEGLYEYRSLSRSSGTEKNDRLTALSTAIQGTIREIDAVDSGPGRTLNSAASWNTVKEKWHPVGDNPAAPGTRDRLVLIDGVVSAAAAFYSHIGDVSNLVLDPDIDTYYTMDIIIFKFPDLLEKLSDMKDLGDTIARSGKLSAEDKTQMIVLSGLVKSDIDGIQGDYEAALRGNAGLKPLLNDALQKGLSSTGALLETVRKKMLDSKSVGIGVEGYSSAIRDSLSSDFGLYDKTAPVLDNLLSLRVQQFSKKKYTNILVAAIMFLLLGYIFIAFYFTVRRTVSHLTDEMNYMAEGDLTREFRSDSSDEIGSLCRPLNKMVQHLGHVIGDVSEAAMGITSFSSEVSAAVEQQATIASEQSAAVAEITTTMEELSASSSQIADHSNAVVEVAAKTLDDTKKGASAVEAVIVKMNDISSDNANSIREIVELGRKSKEISKVMEIINAITDQTKLIAFNAALEASSAGETGKRFGVVAVEIRRLADSVMESTDEIEGKINEIQEAINRLVIASEKGSKGIQEGMEYSNQTANLLFGIVEAAQTTTDAAKQISLSTQQQKTASSQVVLALREIVAGSGQTTDAISQISSITRKLSKLSDNLRELVRKFKVHGSVPHEGKEDKD